MNKIIQIFCVDGGYSEELVRHVVGSLCTSNEFRCAQTDESHSDRPICARKIVPTDRGKILFSKTRGVEFCFNFEYFGTVVDDKWLSFPEEYISSIFNPESNYSHLYITDGYKYRKASVNSVLVKARELLYFVHVLSAAYQVEIKEGKPILHKMLAESNLLPDFKKIYDYTLTTAGLLLGSFFNEEQCKEKMHGLTNVNSNIEHEKIVEFFRRYYKSRDLLES